MAQVSDPRTPTSVQPNIQDVFLNAARRDRLDVLIHLSDGRRLETRIRSFDKFALIVELDGGELLIFKHAISTIERRASTHSDSSRL